MFKENITSKPRVQEFEIDKLLSQFHASIDTATVNPSIHEKMVEVLLTFNSRYQPINVETKSSRAEVLAQVVAGVYAPLIHGFTQSVLKNIKAGNISENIIAPPRDAIPLAVSLKAQSDISGVPVNIIMPHVNRNTAGIANNQKLGVVAKDPLLDLHFDQERAKMNGHISLTEIETGIYGTTSLVMARGFKNRGVKYYNALKFYGLGPNLSYVHALISGGKEWVAENVELKDQLSQKVVTNSMVILDTMEELGMEKHYRSVEQLTLNGDGIVEPVFEPVSEEEREIARVTNQVIQQTAIYYHGAGSEEVIGLLTKIPWLVQQSKAGLPLTLCDAIPPMDSKEEHFRNIRESKLLDYPRLIL